MILDSKYKKTHIVAKDVVGLLLGETTKTGSGPSLINLRLSSGVILSIFLSAWPSNTVTLCVKVIAKTHSAKASYLLTRSLLSVHPPVTLMLILKSIGYFNAPSMD